MSPVRGSCPAWHSSVLWGSVRHVLDQRDGGFQASGAMRGEQEVDEGQAASQPTALSTVPSFSAPCTCSSSLGSSPNTSCSKGCVIPKPSLPSSPICPKVPLPFIPLLCKAGGHISNELTSTSGQDISTPGTKWPRGEEAQAARVGQGT